MHRSGSLECEISINFLQRNSNQDLHSTSLPDRCLRLAPLFREQVPSQHRHTSLFPSTFFHLTERKTDCCLRNAESLAGNSHTQTWATVKQWITLNFHNYRPCWWGCFPPFWRSPSVGKWWRSNGGRVQQRRHSRDLFHTFRLVLGSLPSSWSPHQTEKRRASAGVNGPSASAGTERWILPPWRRRSICGTIKHNANRVTTACLITRLTRVFR